MDTPDNTTLVVDRSQVQLKSKTSKLPSKFAFEYHFENRVPQDTNPQLKPDDKDLQEEEHTEFTDGDAQDEGEFYNSSYGLYGRIKVS